MSTATADRPGVLLINLGTPEAPEVPEVRRYLREFLSDPWVLDINPVGRWLLLNLIILRTRPAQSAEAYKKVWTDEGSPLLVESQRLHTAVSQELPDVPLALAMRYGRPSIPEAIAQLRQRGANRLVVFPLYPHYAESSTRSSVERVRAVLASSWPDVPVDIVPAFYDDPGFLDAFTEVGRPLVESFAPDHVLFSYHGLPERHIHKTDRAGDHCLRSPNCCDAIVDANRDCYRAQCYATTRGLVERLGLPADGHTVCFQSRLGRTPWIQPYTDHLLVERAKAGDKKLLVFCPAFVADCLETLEEIGMRALEDFRAAGGEDLKLVPSLNATPRWTQAVVDLVRPRLSRQSVESDARANAPSSS